MSMNRSDYFLLLQLIVKLILAKSDVHKRVQHTLMAEPDHDK